MTLVERIARLEHSFLPLLSSLPPSVAVRLFSIGRPWFLQKLAAEQASGFKLQTSSFKLQALGDNDVQNDIKPKAYSLKLKAWGLEFNRPLWNSAGMFKNGYGYEAMAMQGAGAFVAGTTTSRVRVGNVRNGIKLPAVPYSKSHAASNWLGLPNDGHAVVAKRLSKLTRVRGCPIGISVSAEPGLDEQHALPELVQGMGMFDDANVDYIELNESCPNVEKRDTSSVLDEHLIQRLEYVSQRFLAHRSRRLPVVVKFSVDTNPVQLEELIQTLITLNFDGIILGNTSTEYQRRRTSIDDADKPLYDYFTSTFGGGISGAVLTKDSLMLAALAVSIVKRLSPAHEFHVIRCGGVMNAHDIAESAAHGVMLNQWYTGYFERFSKDGHAVYAKLDS